MAKVLVVDDEEPVRLLITTILEMAGHEVEQAIDGQDGLDKVAGGTYDVILLDAMMPRLTGYDVLNRLRADASFSTPVLMVTAQDEPEGYIAEAAAGVVDHVRKPFRGPDLEAAVERILTVPTEHRTFNVDMKVRAAGVERSIRRLREELAAAEPSR